MEFFSSLEVILHTKDLPKRFALFDELYAHWPSIDFKHHSPISPLSSPIYEGICPIRSPKHLIRPKQINTSAQMGAFLHSLAHIEYSAIDLALDALYRFRHLPLEYYQDWLEVAKEEIGHFISLQTLLQSCGYDYGDFPVHTHLFDAMKATPIFADRMALVHRGLEAGGLDANPFVSQKVSRSSHFLKESILKQLAHILHDEISHVRKGDRWWKYAQDPRSFKEILIQYGYTLPKTLNHSARLQCGFTQEELNALKSH